MMKKILLYGAGKRGRKVARLLMENGLKVSAFADSFLEYREIEVGGGKIPVLNISEIKENARDYAAVVTINDYDSIIEMETKLKELGVEVTTTEKLIEIGADRVKANRDFIAAYHEKEMEDYYEIAEKALDFFWNKDKDAYPMFCQLNLDVVVELACGHGRHVPQYIEKAGKVLLVDILEKNIEYCRKRFPGESKIEYYVNNGYDLRQIADGSCTALFTYDSMIHFELLDIFNYLKETYRILVPGGRALFHHSNNTEDYRITFSTGQDGHNYMSKDLFAHLADRAGLKIVEQKLIDWSKKDLGCLTLVEK